MYGIWYLYMVVCSYYVTYITWDPVCRTRCV